MNAPNHAEVAARHAARKKAVHEALQRAQIPGDAAHGYVLLELAVTVLHATGAVKTEAQRGGLHNYVVATLKLLDDQAGG